MASIEIQEDKAAPVAPKIKRTREGLGKYKVTETAGPFVAGRRSPGEGKQIELTDAQAEHPLRTGEIEPA